MSTGGDVFYGITQGSPGTELDVQFPFYPLTAPGMPMPGPNFVAEATKMGDQPLDIEGQGEGKRLNSFGRNLHYLYRRALYDENFTLPISVRGITTSAPFVPGHLMADDTRDMNGGPRPSRVMLIGKHPGHEEVANQRNFVGPTSDELFKALEELGMGETDWAEWYVTNLVKWPQLDRQSDTLPVAWKADNAVLLAQELRLVRPDYVLCLGTEASKFLLGTPYSVSAMTGRVMDLPIPIFDRGESPVYHVAKVMTSPHPASVFHKPEMSDPFKAQLGLFLQLTNGADIGGVERDIDHRMIYKERQLAEIVNEIRADPARWIIAVDGEWHGKYPTEPGAYLRTVQFSSKHGEGHTVVLRHQGGQPAFQPSLASAIKQLNRLLVPDEAAGYYPCVGGHFLRADLPWLYFNGVNLIPQYGPPADPTRILERGWDTSLEYHSVHETASFKLEDVATRLTTVPRYDSKLQEWKKDYCKTYNLTEEELDGYGMCPGWILHPYGSYDADATRRIHMRCIEEGGLLDKDWFGNSSWDAYWVAHRASPAFLEMEMTGICLDSQRVDELTTRFMLKRAELLEAFRGEANWPDFNPSSYKHCIAVLFGDQYAYRTNKDTGERTPIRPRDAMTMNLTPIKSTGKRSKLWADLVARREEAYYTPSSDKEVLGIIGHSHKQAMRLRDLKFIAQVLKSVLRPPVLDPITNEPWQDDDGRYTYEKGLAAVVHHDGRVRTHMYQTKETGRASSARPPLQNLSKRREDDYKRILGKDYTHPVRSILRAAPGHVLIEADYTGAELAVIAWLSGDPLMIDHVRRNALPEDHPDHYDMHAQTAVRVFELKGVTPTKKGMKIAKVPGLRVAAKNVNFGIPYGRSAEAISRQCREEGVEISVDDTQKIIDFYFSQYVLVGNFLAECRRCVVSPQNMCTAFMRRRRCVTSRDKKVRGEQERQFQNFPIQGTVADAVSRALDHLYWYRFDHPEVQYKIALQIHDAILFEVPAASVVPFMRDVLTHCMVDSVPVWPRKLDGTLMPVAAPYHFGIDSEICINWGEEITDEQAKALGIDLQAV